DGILPGIACIRFQYDAGSVYPDILKELAYGLSGANPFGQQARHPATENSSRIRPPLGQPYAFGQPLRGFVHGKSAASGTHPAILEAAKNDDSGELCFRL